MVITNHHPVATGVTWGMFWGVLFGLLFFVPVFGLAVGGVFGALFGLIDTIGIDKEFQRQVRDMVKPGTSALFMAVDKLTTDKAIEALSKYGATVLKSSLSEDADRQIQEALHGGATAIDRQPAMTGATPVATECRAATPELRTDTELDRLCVDTIRMGHPGRHRHRRMRPRPLRRPSCTLQPAPRPRTANPAGASGLMQTGIGGAAGDACDPLRKYLPNPDLGPHDPTTAVQLGALVLIKDKGAPTGQPINTYFPYARADNGTGWPPTPTRPRHGRHRQLPRQRPDHSSIVSGRKPCCSTANSPKQTRNDCVTDASTSPPGSRSPHARGSCTSLAAGRGPMRSRPRSRNSKRCPLRPADRHPGHYSPRAEPPASGHDHHCPEPGGLARNVPA